MNQNAIDKLQSVFRLAFNLDKGTEITTLQQSQAAFWDSMAHITLVAALESEFNVAFDTAEIVSLNSYQTTLDLLRQKGLV